MPRQQLLPLLTCCAEKLKLNVCSSLSTVAADHPAVQQMTELQGAFDRAVETFAAA